MEWYRILPSALACTLGSSRRLATMRLNFAFLGIIISLEWTIFADFPHWFCQQSHGIFCLTDFVLHLTVIAPYLPDRIPELRNPCPKFWRQMSFLISCNTSLNIIPIRVVRIWNNEANIYRISLYSRSFMEFLALVALFRYHVSAYSTPASNL